MITLISTSFSLHTGSHSLVWKLVLKLANLTCPCELAQKVTGNTQHSGCTCTSSAHEIAVNNNAANTMPNNNFHPFILSPFRLLAPPIACRVLYLNLLNMVLLILGEL